MLPNPFFKERPGFRKLYIFGAGGAGRGIAWLARQSWGDAVEIVFLVDHPRYLVAPVHGYEVKLVSDISPDDSARYVISIASPAERCRIAPVLDAIPLRATSIVHPRAEMSEYVEVGDGAIICAGSLISNDSKVGAHCYVNVNTMLGHDVTVGDHSTISPNVSVAGYVDIGKRVFLGIGANIINGSRDNPLVIGDDAYVAAGACVIQSVPAGAMVAGVPAVQKHRK